MWNKIGSLVNYFYQNANVFSEGIEIVKIIQMVTVKNRHAAFGYGLKSSLKTT